MTFCSHYTKLKWEYDHVQKWPMFPTPEPPPLLTLPPHLPYVMKVRQHSHPLSRQMNWAVAHPITATSAALLDPVHLNFHQESGKKRISQNRRWPRWCANRVQCGIEQEAEVVAHIKHCPRRAKEQNFQNSCMTNFPAKQPSCQLFANLNGGKYEIVYDSDLKLTFGAPMLSWGVMNMMRMQSKMWCNMCK